MPIRIAIAEDNSFALKACLDRLSGFPDIRVQYTCYNGEELMETMAGRVPDVVLMDIQMPGMGGIACTEKVKSLYPQVKVLMLTTFDDDESIFKAIMAGASGYLLKDEDGAGIDRAIREALGEGAPMSAGIALKVLNLLRNPPVFDETPTDYGLTRREIDLLVQLKNGLSYDRIAENLFISTGTVRKHIENIYRKLQVNNKVSAVERAVKGRLV